MRHERDMQADGDKRQSVELMAVQSGEAASVDDNALFPRSVRRWVGGCLSVLLLASAYLIAVRGNAILFDLRDAISAFCF